jgi:hypothetical protein
MIHRSTPELLKMQAELETKITNLNLLIKTANSHINTILNNTNELTGIDVDDLVHKSD